jgi:hypothetical protein
MFPRRSGNNLDACAFSLFVVPFSCKLVFWMCNNCAITEKWYICVYLYLWSGSRRDEEFNFHLNLSNSGDSV